MSVNFYIFQCFWHCARARVCVCCVYNIDDVNHYTSSTTHFGFHWSSSLVICHIFFVKIYCVYQFQAIFKSPIRNFGIMSQEVERTICTHIIDSGRGCQLKNLCDIRYFPYFSRSRNSGATQHPFEEHTYVNDTDNRDQSGYALYMLSILTIPGRRTIKS